MSQILQNPKSYVENIVTKFSLTLIDTDGNKIYPSALKGIELDIVFRRLKLLPIEKCYGKITVKGVSGRKPVLANNIDYLCLVARKDKRK